MPSQYCCSLLNPNITEQPIKVIWHNTNWTTTVLSRAGAHQICYLQLREGKNIGTLSAVRESTSYIQCLQTARSRSFSSNPHHAHLTVLPTLVVDSGHWLKKKNGNDWLPIPLTYIFYCGLGSPICIIMQILCAIFNSWYRCVVEALDCFRPTSTDRLFFVSPNRQDSKWFLS